MTLSHRLAMLLAASSAMSPAVASAQLLTPVSQTRLVEATVDDFTGPIGTPTVIDSDTATDFAAFSGMASEMLGFPSSTAEATQTSSINSPVDSFVASGTVTAFPAWGPGDVEAAGYSSYTVVFDAAYPFSYAASGDGGVEVVVGDAMASLSFADVFFTLKDVTAATTIFSTAVASTSFGASMNPISQTGSLPAGRYELSIGASASALADFSEQFPSAEADFNLTFTATQIPEPGSGCLTALVCGVCVSRRMAMKRRRSRT